MKINSKELKPFLLPGVVIFLILIITTFILKPKLELVINYRQQLIKDKKILTDLTKKLATLEGLAKVEFSEKTDIALAVLPAEKNVPNSLFVIKGMALNNGLVLSNITIGSVGEIATVSSTEKIRKDTILPSFKLNASFFGEIKMIKDFISQIQSTAPLMGVESFSISQKKTLIPEVKMEIEAYFLSFPETLGKPEQQLTMITSAEEKMLNRISEFTFFRSEGDLPNLPVGKENLFSP